MPKPEQDPLNDAVHNLLGARPTPRQREALAARLREIADRQEALAAAQRRDQARPGERRLAPRQRRAGPGVAPGRFIRIERPQYGGQRSTAAARLVVYVGRGLWYDIGSPERLDIQRHGANGFVLVPVAGAAGFAVQSGKGMPRIQCKTAEDIVSLPDGRYEAEIRARTIVVSGNPAATEPPPHHPPPSAPR